MKFLTVFFLFVSIPVNAVDSENDASGLNCQPYSPWFTGPLLAPTPVNMKPSHPAIEPSITLFDIYGKYDSNWKVKKESRIWAINPFIDFQFGFTDYLGLETLISSISNFQDGQTSTHLQDTSLLLGYQVSNDQPYSWVPDFRLILQGVFPSGSYQKLDPKKRGIDSTGQGAFQTGPVFAFQKRFCLFYHFCSLRWSFTYLFPTSVHVKGFNTYGGGFGTKGKARPGQTIIIFFSGEYSLNQYWALAFDTEFFHQKKSHFSGKKGLTAEDTVASTTIPASTQISFAPEVEYNFASNTGLLLGAWFTLGGKNSNAFASIFGAYLYVF